MDKALEKKLRKEQRRLKKETKKARKEEKRRKRKLEEEQLELDKKIEDDASWKKQKKLIDLGPVKVLSVIIFQCFHNKFPYDYFFLNLNSTLLICFSRHSFHTPNILLGKEFLSCLTAVYFQEEEIYGGNEHFNFGKPKKEIPPPPAHNPRPDFEKADWRDIEMWKAVREKEKQEKGEKETNWKEEEHYLPSRFRKE